MNNLLKSVKRKCGNLGYFAKLLVACTAFSMSYAAIADIPEISDDGLGNQWMYRLCEGGCEIVGNGTDPATVSSAVGDIVIPTTLDGYTVVRIGEDAFYMCDGMTSLTIPSSVASIAHNAFIGCTGLESFETSDNLNYVTSDGMLLTSDRKTLVAVPGGLSSVTIPSSVTSIGYWAFSGGVVKSLEIPSNVTNISECAFFSCYELESLVISSDGGDLDIGDMAFVGCPLYRASIPSRVKNIGIYAFSRDIYVPVDHSDTVVPSIYVVDVSYRDTARVKGLLAASMHDMDDIWFAEQDQYGNMRTEVDGYMWYFRPNDDGHSASIVRRDNLGNRDSAVYPMPVGAVSIPYRLCSYRVVNIGDGALNFGPREYNPEADITDVTIPAGITNIGVCAFAWCNSMTNLTIGPSVKSIGESAFQNCSGLTSVDIPDTVERIDESAFWACTSLSRVKISLGMTSIAPCVFQQCAVLRDVVLPPSVTRVDTTAFAGVDLGSLTIHVLPGKTDECKTMFRDSGYTTSEINSITFVEGDGNGMSYENGYTWYYRIVNSKAVLGRNLDDEGPDVNHVACSPEPSGTVTIPTTLSGYQVTCIGLEAFKDCLDLREVNIQSNVTNINPYAFVGCTDLIGFSVDSDNGYYMSNADGMVLTKDGATLFAFPGGNASVTFPNSVTSIGTAAFDGGMIAGTVEVPAAVTNIGELAFSCCMDLSELVIPDDGADFYIGNDAFSGCCNLTSVRIPARVKGIGDWAFSISGLETVYVSSGDTLRVIRMFLDSKHYMDGIRFIEPDGSEMITVSDCAWRYRVVDDHAEIYGISASPYNLPAAFPATGDLEIPEYLDGYPVTRIEDHAFYGCEDLTSIAIPDGDADLYIGREAFSYCSNLRSMRIPSCVNGIGQGAFEGTPLKIVYVNEGDTDRVKGMLSASGLEADDIAKITFMDGEEGPLSIKGDPDAVVIGNATDGYEITPSTTAGTVEVNIPESIEAEKVTVVLPPTASAKLNGAKVKVVKGGNDITVYLDIPAANAGGVTDLNAATVKEAIVKEVFDSAKGAKYDLVSDNPSIKTAPTRPGLTYSFSEGTSLGGMVHKAQKLGDGTAFEPTISVKRTLSPSGFYSIRVTK